jgi:GTPase
MLIDRVEVVFKAGDGGGGKSSFRRNQKGPDGGNGGRGGDVYVVAKPDLKLLNQFSRKILFAAENGVPGGTNQRTGADGKDLEIELPVGTSIIDKKTGQELYDLKYLNERVLLAKGGKGGRGNWEFRTSTNTTPRHAEPGVKGEVKEVVLSLKLIADFGLIGLPNAGKSSLLNELTGSHAKTANYPFTTLSASLGVLNGKVMADIPGLIEGASEGRGLGIGFLKHIEKVRVLLHCISVESTDVAKDYKTIRKELGEYNPKMLEKPEIILLTKSDMSDEDTVIESVNRLKGVGKVVLPVSIHDFTSLKNLQKLLFSN